MLLFSENWKLALFSRLEFCLACQCWSLKFSKAILIVWNRMQVGLLIVCLAGFVTNFCAYKCYSWILVSFSCLSVCLIWFLIIYRNWQQGYKSRCNISASLDRLWECICSSRRGWPSHVSLSHCRPFISWVKFLLSCWKFSSLSLDSLLSSLFVAPHFLHKSMVSFFLSFCFG